MQTTQLLPNIPDAWSMQAVEQLLCTLKLSRHGFDEALRLYQIEQEHLLQMPGELSNEGVARLRELNELLAV